MGDLQEVAERHRVWFMSAEEEEVTRVELGLILEYPFTDLEFTEGPHGAVVRFRIDDYPWERGKPRPVSRLETVTLAGIRWATDFDFDIAAGSLILILSHGVRQ